MSKNRLLSVPETTPGQRFMEEQNSGLIVPTLDGGMNIKIDPADLENNEFTVAQNVYIRNKRITRRFGTSGLGPTKPNSQAISKMYTAKQSDGTVVQIRFGQTTIHRRASGSWTAITPASSAITGPANNVVSTDNRHFFSNNGLQNIQEIDLAGNTYDDLGNAPKYKYITSFYNRIVGANLVDAGNDIPIQVGWSGDFNFDEWDTTVDPSAGFAPLEESQSDYSDSITGLYGFAKQMIVLREQSIWLANKIPGTNPFYFYTAVPSIGCDTPTSVQKIPGGIIFFDRRTKSVYMFTVESGLVNIGFPVEDGIFSSIADPNQVFSGFNTTELEYMLACPIQSTDTVRVWTFSIKSSRD